MTINCDVPIEEARKVFAAAPEDGAAADYIESALEYWRLDFIDDQTLANDLRVVADWLSSKPQGAASTLSATS